jgi:hypothetical protein
MDARIETVGATNARGPAMPRPLDPPRLVALIALALAPRALAPQAGVPTPVPRPLTAVLGLPPRHVTSEEGDARIAQRVRGYAGLHLRAASAVLLLVDTTRREEAIAAVGGVLAERGIAARDVRVRRARYDARQLLEFKRRASGARPGHSVGWMAVNIDILDNRIEVGVPGQADVEPMRRSLAALGIPGDAAIVEVRDRYHPMRAGSKATRRR